MTASCFLDVDPNFALYPLNVFRDEPTLHFGVRSIANQWQEVLQSKPHLRVHTRLLPTASNVRRVLSLAADTAWKRNDSVVAVHGGNLATEVELGEPEMLRNCGDLFEQVAQGLEADLERLKLAWRLRTLSEDERDAWASRGIVVNGAMDRIHLGPGAKLRDGSYNTESGDIVIGPSAEVMEGCRIRGPFALGEGSTLRMGSLVYGPTTIGKGCKVGGEVSNVVIHDYSNKAHGGFLGNSVLGSWCNLGAETTCSNLKNTYGHIAEWNASSQSFESQGRTFCGLIMGDHSKTAIHTAFSTATVVGPMCNVFGDATPPRHLPPFSWGCEGETHDLERALDTARKVMARRSVEMPEAVEARIRQAFGERS